MGKIDEILIQRNRKREKIRNLLYRYVEEQIPITELPDLEREISVQNQETQQLLFDIMMDEKGEVSNLALLILSENPTPRISHIIEKHLDLPHITGQQRSRLRALLVLHPDEYKKKESPGTHHKMGEILDFIDNFWQMMNPEDIGQIWIDEYHNTPARNKISLLGALFASGSTNYLPIYSVELGSPQVTVSRFVAESLGEMDSEEALRLLKTFPEPRHTGTRLAVEESLKTLRRKKRNGELAPGREKDNIPFFKAYVAEEDSTGFISVIFSRKTMQGSIRFLFALIDRWDRGIINCYGDEAGNTDDFYEMVELLNFQSSMIHYSESKKSYALWLLQEAEKLTLERGYHLLPDYLLWRRLIRDERKVSTRYPVRFGLSCCECGTPIRTVRDEIDAWIIHDIALCPDCIKKKTHCESCRSPLDPQKAYALARSDMAHITVICENCYLKANRKSHPPQ